MTREVDDRSDGGTCELQIVNFDCTERVELRKRRGPAKLSGFLLLRQRCTKFLGSWRLQRVWKVTSHESSIIGE